MVARPPLTRRSLSEAHRLVQVGKESYYAYKTLLRQFRKKYNRIQRVGCGNPHALNELAELIEALESDVLDSRTIIRHYQQIVDSAS